MILLSFDIEEFDVPKEHQVDISMEEQIKVSVEGTTRILDCLERNQVKATFFCTANFALHAPDIIKRIQEGGHEIASHGFYHWTFEVEKVEGSVGGNHRSQSLWLSAGTHDACVGKSCI